MPDVDSIDILLVDDEPSIINALKRLLYRFGYKVMTAYSGKEGLKLLEEHRCSVVISDMRMPEMNGGAFLKKVAQRWPDTVRMLLTGYSDPKDAIDAINTAGIFRYINKPWCDSDIIDAVKEAKSYYQQNISNKRSHETTLQQNQHLQSQNDHLQQVVEKTGDELANATADRG